MLRLENTVAVKVVLLDGAKVPVYATEGAAGCDIYAIESGVVKADTIVGVKKEPIGYYAIVDSDGNVITRLTDEQVKAFEDRLRQSGENFEDKFINSFMHSVSEFLGSLDKRIKDPVRQFKRGGFLQDFFRPSTGIKFIQTGEQDVECDFNDPDAYRLKPKKHPLVISTGLRMEIPAGVELELRGRSGLAFKHNLLAFNGTVDSDFRGILQVKIFNEGDEDFYFQAGDRICQGVFKRVLRAEFVVVDNLSETDRGENGFGSTGLN